MRRGICCRKNRSNRKSTLRRKRLQMRVSAGSKKRQRKCDCCLMICTMQSMRSLSSTDRSRSHFAADICHTHTDRRKRYSNGLTIIWAASMSRLLVIFLRTSPERPPTESQTNVGWHTHKKERVREQRGMLWAILKNICVLQTIPSITWTTSKRCAYWNGISEASILLREGKQAKLQRRKSKTMCFSACTELQTMRRLYSLA